MDLFGSTIEEMADRFGDVTDIQPDVETSRRWEDLFHLEDSYSAIVQHRKDLNYWHVSNEHWELVRAKEETKGHNRESYEYSLTLVKQKLKPRATNNSAADRGEYLLLLNPTHPTIASARAVQKVVGLGVALKQEAAEDGSEFVRLSGAAKAELEAVLDDEYPSIQPLFVRITQQAEKALHPSSLYPTLGVESTLPHRRFDDADGPSLVLQEQYPVWYFFYGSHGDEAILRRVLGNANPVISYHAAKVCNAALTTWGGKYMALVDGTDTVNGLGLPGAE